MTALAISRWIFARSLRSPLAWGLLWLCALSWPALTRFIPLGITTANREGNALLYEVAFLAAMLGAVIGLRALESIQTVLRRASGSERLLAELTALWVSAGLWGLVAVLAPLRSGGMTSGERLALLVGLILAAGQLAVLGALLLRTRLPVGVRSLGLLLLAWWIPSLLGTNSHLERWTSALLDVAATLRPPSEGWSPSALLVRLAPMMGLGLIAWWITGGRSHDSANPT